MNLGGKGPTKTSAAADLFDDFSQDDYLNYNYADF